MASETSSTEKDFRRLLYFLVGGCLLLPLGSVPLQLLHFSGTCLPSSLEPQSTSFMSGMIVMFGIACLLLMLFASPVLVAMGKVRWRAVAMSLAAVFVVPVGAFLLLGANQAIMDWRIGVFAERMEPLIVAIYAYETEHGMPPAELDELTPKYLDQIPDSGWCEETLSISYMRPESDEPPVHWSLGVDLLVDVMDPVILRFRGRDKDGVTPDRSGDHRGWTYAFH